MEALTTQPDASLATGAFEVTRNCKVWVDVEATFAATGAITMQHSRDRGASWATFNTDGTDQKFLEDQYKLYDLPGGRWYRFKNDANVTLTTIYVSGNAINVNVPVLNP